MAGHNLIISQNGHHRDLDGDLARTEVLPALPPAPHLKNAKECRTYLRSLPGGPACLRDAEELSRRIKVSHPINEDFHHWAADGIVIARNQLEEKLVASCCQSHLLTNWEGHSSNIPTALESVLVSGIHCSTLQSLEIACGKEDISLHELTVSVSSVTCCRNRCSDSWGRLGKELAEFCSISGQFLGKDLAPAAAMLQHMEQTFSCPLEVAEGIEDSMHSIVEAAAVPSDSCRESDSCIPDMTADDVLGLMIATVILAQPHCMISMLEYVKAFYTSGDWAGQTGFQIATLEAATAFLLQQAAAEGNSKADAGMARNSSMSLLWALLDSDEPLTFTQNAAPLQTALRKAAQSTADAQTDRQLKHLLSRSSLNKYGDAPALRTMLSDELTERAASLHRSASLQRRHSCGSASSGAPGSPLQGGRHGPYSFASSVLQRQDSRSSASSAAGDGRHVTANGTSATASDATHVSINGASSDAIAPGRPAMTNGGSSGGHPSSVQSPGLALDLQHCEESTGAVGSDVGEFPAFYPMSSPFRSAAWSTDPSPQHSMQPNENQHAARSIQQLELNSASRGTEAVGDAPQKSDSMQHKGGDRAQEERENSDHSVVTGNEGLVGFRGDDEKPQGRRKKSDQLAAALRRMSMRADEQLRVQADRVLKSSG